MTRVLLVVVAGLLTALTIVPPSEAPELAAPEPPPPRWQPGLHFVSSVDIDEDALTRVAEASWATAMRLMGYAHDDFFMGPLTVYVCADWEELRRVSYDRGRREMTPVIGWYDRYGPAVLLRHDATRDALTIAHELTHHAVAQVTDRCPPLFNEGLACLVTQIVLDGVEHGDAIEDQERRWVWQVRKAQRDHKLPSLWRLMGRGFYDNTHLHYPLALCLARVLARRSPGALREMMGRFDSERTIMAFTQSYRAWDVNDDWLEEVDAFAASGSDRGGGG